MSIPESVLREIERAIEAAEFPRGMNVHDGKARVDSSHLRRLLAELATLRAENDRLRDELQKVRSAAISGMDAATQHGRGLVQQAAKLRAESNPDSLESERAANAMLTEQLQKAEAERDKLLGCRDELREIAEAISDPRIHNTMTIAECVKELQAQDAYSHSVRMQYLPHQVPHAQGSGDL